MPIKGNQFDDMPDDDNERSEPDFPTPMLDAYRDMPSHMAELRLTLLRIGARAMHIAITQGCNPYLSSTIARAGAVAYDAACSLSEDDVREALITLRALREFFDLSGLEHIMLAVSHYEEWVAFPDRRRPVKIVETCHA